jgi:hypothetical protein
MKKVFFFLLVALSLVLVSCAPIIEQSIGEQSENTEKVVATVNDEKIKETVSGTKYIVHPSKIRGGGPPKDGIPSIDNPRFNPISGIGWVEDNELVMAIEYNGIKRVYPLQIMVWHEIVNDKFGDERVLITYCPLCGSGIAYKPVIEVNGVSKSVEFGTSGKLYNSNLVMYDRETDTYWSQIGGKAIIGSLTGQQLEAISIDTVVWRDYNIPENNDAEVLSRSTGHSRDYGRDPYGNYYEDSFLIFPVENEDDRVHPKTIIFGIEKDGKFKAYREDDLVEKGEVVDDEFGVVVSRGKDGIVKIVDDSGKEIVKERDMWFAWYAFHPNTELYGVEPNN